MPNTASILVGEVEELWRYPVKSMMGEQLTATEVTENGLLGDRAYALRDTADGKIAATWNPGSGFTLREWPSGQVRTPQPQPWPKLDPAVKPGSWSPALCPDEWSPRHRTPSWHGPGLQG